MSYQPTPTPWGNPQQRVAPKTQPPLPPRYPGQPGPQPQPAGHLTTSLASGPVNARPFVKKSGRQRVAGLVTLAVLAGGLGGGAAGFAAAQYLAPAGTGVQTQVVPAEADHPNWATVAKTAADAVVGIEVTSPAGQAQGSGVVIDAQGHIVTNNHVVAGTGGQAELRVRLGNSSYAATLVGTDPTTDLAVIKLVGPPTELAVLGFADSAQLAVGDQVMAIGNPLGLDDSVTTGIISALNRPVTTQAVTNQPTRTGSDSLVVTSAIQTNAAINPGNSGGALIDSAGQLVGITSSIATLSSGSQESGNIGIGFAIPANQVKYVADQLIATGSAQHPQIGLSATDVTGTGQLGAEVSRVSADSPAAAAGIQVGDLVTAVNGVPVASTESLVAQVRSGEVGKTMTLTVLRAGAEKSIELTPVAATN